MTLRRMALKNNAKNRSEVDASAFQIFAGAQSVPYGTHLVASCLPSTHKTFLAERMLQQYDGFFARPGGDTL